MEKGNKQLSNTQLWRKAIRVAAGIDDGYVPVQIFDAVVKAGSQNSDEMTCVVDSCDSTCNNLVVRYNLCISDGRIEIPADGSTVTIAKTSFTDPYIVKSTDLKSSFLGIGNQSWSNDGIIQDFEFYVPSGEPSGSFGGFIKNTDPTNPEKGLLKALNNLQNDINNLKTLLSTLLTTTINTASPGDPDLFQIALKTGLTSYLSMTIPVSSTDDLENPNIVHGLTNLP